LRATRTAHQVAREIAHPHLDIAPKSQVAPPLELLDRDESSRAQPSALRLRVLLLVLMLLLVIQIAVWTMAS